jgi:STE24 endopeptidase
MNHRRILTLACLALALFAGASGSQAQQSPGPRAKPATAMPEEIPIPFAAQPSSHFDVEAATDAYLAEIPASARAKSDEYFEGGYWLILWDFLYGVVVYLLLLHFRWSAIMRNLA